MIKLYIYFYIMPFIAQENNISDIERNHKESQVAQPRTYT